MKNVTLKRIIPLVILVVSMLTIAGLFIQKNVVASNVDEKVKLAYKYITEGKYEEAIAIYNEALKIDPNNATLYTNIGIAYTANGNYDKAKIYLKKAIEIDNKKATAYEELSRISIIEGKEKEARKILQETPREVSNSEIESSLKRIEERTLVGQIVDAENGNKIKNAYVVGYAGDDFSKKTIEVATKKDGSFAVKAVPGEYKLIVNRDGYKSTETYQTISKDNITYQTKIRLLQKKEETNKEDKITINVKDAFTGKLIKAEELKADFVPGLYSDNPPIEKSFQTKRVNENGSCEAVLPIGNYTVLISSNNNGFKPSSAQIVVGGVEKNEIISLTPVLKENEIRAVLTWSKPDDLDAFVKNSDGQIVYFKNNKIKGNNKISLDTDVTSGYGPETITIVQDINKEDFSYYVDHFYEGRNIQSDRKNVFLATSGAKVVVYKGNNEKRVFNVPTNKNGTTWKVFEVVDGEIRGLNEIGTGSMVGYTDDGIIG